MLFQRMGSQPASISDAVYLEVVATLNSSLVPAALMISAQLVVGFVIARQTGDAVVTGGLTGLAVIIALVRVCVVLAFRRRSTAGPLALAEARRWGRYHMIGSAGSSLVVGLVVGRSLMFDDPICLVVAIGIGMRFSNGIVVRLSLLPRLAVANLAMLALPALLVALWRMDGAHIAYAVLIAIHYADSLEMVRRTFNSTINHVLLKQQYERLARIDPMTGLHNRSVLASDLPRLVAGRGDRLLAIHAIDLDHFKAANDRFGHPVGDALLKEVADRLATLAGEGNPVIRMGGDEFVLAQTTALSLGEVETFAGAIFEVVSAPYCIQGRDIVIGASIGVAIAGRDGETTDALLSRADMALYQAKVYRGGYVLTADLPPSSQPDDVAANGRLVAA